LTTKGHVVRPGELGENISTRNVDLLSLPAGTRLNLGSEAVIELTGLRNPCKQIEKFQPGLLAHLIESRPTELVRKCGVMSIVIRGGEIKHGDAISIELPPLPYTPLAYVVPASKAAVESAS
jgi:MOSC domain-containing protein YiiM